MNKIKNKWFYIYSFLFYLLLMVIFTFLSNKFLAPSARSFLLSDVTSNLNVNEDIIEVVIDDETNQKYNWHNDPTKSISADLLDYFYTYSHPKVSGLDVVYISLRDDAVSKAGNFVNQISKMDNLVSGFVPEPDEMGSDEVFIDSFATAHSINVDLKTHKNFNTQYNGIMSYSDVFRNSIKHFGTVNAQSNKGSDYIFESINIVKIKNNFYPSLPFKMYLMANDTNDIIIDDKYVTVPKTGLKFQYNYDNGLFFTPLRYYDFLVYKDKTQGYSHNSISAYRILDTYKALKQGVTPKTNPELYDLSKPNALIDPKIFDNKIIFIGEHISGPREDVLRTPIDNRHPGVDILATVYDNLDSQAALKNSGNLLNLLLFFILCIPTFIIILRAKFIKGILSLIILDLVYLYTIMLFAAYGGYIMSYASPMICQFVTAVFAYTFKFINESRNKEQIKTAMGKYISKDVMNNVVKNIDTLGLGGKRAIVTVLFSDIRGFTSMSEKMSAEDVSKILNEYFAEMEPIINKYNGVINKFIGDAIMVIFGEPIQDLNHPRNAVKCAYEMLKRVNFLREKWLEEGRPRFEIGVGINTGEVFIGNIGTENRMEYTVIGDSVNLASRIEGYNKVYKTNLLVSSSTYNYISDCADVIKIKEVQIRGKSKKMDIYEVLRIDLDK